MKFTFISLIVTLIFSCNTLSTRNSIEAGTSGKQLCTDNYDSLLVKYANEFHASNIELNKSFSQQLDSFLTHVDTLCLRQQKEYKIFVVEILCKLCLYHLKCCNQGYDLLSMRTGAAKTLINEFIGIAGLKGHYLEMLNSEYVLDVIKNDKSLEKNEMIQNLSNKIKKEQERIKKGNI